MIRRIYMGEPEHRKFKDDLEDLAQRKIRDLADFPVWITPTLKDRIKNLQDEFLFLRQNKKFNEEKGVDILKEIDDINKNLDAIPQSDRDAAEIAAAARRKRSSKAKPKRKIIKKVIKRKK